MAFLELLGNSETTTDRQDLSTAKGNSPKRRDMRYFHHNSDQDPRTTLLVFLTAKVDRELVPALRLCLTNDIPDTHFDPRPQAVSYKNSRDARMVECKV